MKSDQLLTEEGQKEFVKQVLESEKTRLDYESSKSSLELEKQAHAETRLKLEQLEDLLAATRTPDENILIEIMEYNSNEKDKDGNSQLERGCSFQGRYISHYNDKNSNILKILDEAIANSKARDEKRKQESKTNS